MEGMNKTTHRRWEEVYWTLARMPKWKFWLTGGTMAQRIVLALTLYALMQPAFAQTATTIPSIGGSWEFTLKPASKSAASSVSGVATFTSDGSVIEANTSEVALHATPGHGIWQPSPAFGNLFIRFTSLAANAEGMLRSKTIITMTVALNATGDEFSGGYSFQVVDPTGRVITTGSGTVTAQQMVHPLLP
jgi:hypothetical protein